SLLRDTAALVSDNPQQSQRIDTIRGELESFQRDHIDPLVQARRANPDQAVAIVRSGRGKQMLDKIRADLGDFIRAEQDLLTARTVDDDAANAQLEFIVIVGTALVVLLGFAISYFLARSIGRRIERLARAADAITRG